MFGLQCMRPKFESLDSSVTNTGRGGPWVLTCLRRVDPKSERRRASRLNRRGLEPVVVLCEYLHEDSPDDLS